MRPYDPRPWMSVCLLAGALYVGCTTQPETSSSGPVDQGSRSASPAKPAAPPAKLFANLGEPVGVLIIAGQHNGYLEPCGCSEDQSGGLIRLYDLVERLEQQKWPTALIDLGGLVKNPMGARGGFEQSKIKLDYAIRALALLKCRALGLGVDDLKVGVGEALGLYLNSLGETTRLVVANLEPAQEYQSLFRKSVIASSGSIRLGVTSVVDPAWIQGLADPDRDVLLPGLHKPEDVLPAVLADLESHSDYQVLMVQGPPEMARRLAATYPGFDIVVSTCEFPDPLSHDPELLNGGGTMLVTVGQKGRNVGVFGFYASQAQPPKFQLVTLNKRFDGPGKAMKKLIEDEFRETLKSVGVVENILRRDHPTAPAGSRFAGVETCRACHPKTVDQWEGTGHANAFETLLEDKKPNTQYDAECISCHTTGFEFNSGWISAEKTPHLEGNQCENCHGPASLHVAEPDNKVYRQALALTVERADKSRQCISCHDEENSRNFDFPKYWKKVEHKGLDDYKDPRVHQGRQPAPAAHATVKSS